MVVQDPLLCDLPIQVLVGRVQGAFPAGPFVGCGQIPGGADGGCGPEASGRHLWA